ncbi:MAG: hypothetical protein ACYC6N_11160 [Pirellulaceae bacterium]
MKRRADLPRTAAQWNALITDAIETPNPVLSNFKITRVHYLLSCALQDTLGPPAGPNFHSWAVWGSRKAGITIRQEDKDQASRDASFVAGMVGAVVGIGAGWLFATPSGATMLWSILLWMIIGVLIGGYCGYLLAGYTRRAAARLILEGNRIVLEDIGRETARYLDYVSRSESEGNKRNSQFRLFLQGFRAGRTELGSQDLLHRAFEQYETSRRSPDNLKLQHECNYFANCLAVLHEHIRLQPYISKSLPFLIRKCVTQRLMTYSVGATQLAVHEDVPPLTPVLFPESLVALGNAELREFLDGPDGWDVGRGQLKNTRANDWTKLRDRMGYIVNLFRTQHLAVHVVSPPYSEEQLRAIAAGRLPSRPW